MKYEEPKIEVNMFIKYEVITSSGLENWGTGTDDDLDLEL